MLDKKVNRHRDRQPDRYRVTDRQTDRQIIVKRYTYEKFVSFEGSGHLYCKVESVTFIPLKWREHNADVIGGKPCWDTSSALKLRAKTLLFLCLDKIRVL